MHKWTFSLDKILKNNYTDKSLDLRFSIPFHNLWKVKVIVFSSQKNIVSIISPISLKISEYGSFK